MSGPPGGTRPSACLSTSMNKARGQYSEKAHVHAAQGGSKAHWCHGQARKVAGCLIFDVRGQLPLDFFHLSDAELVEEDPRSSPPQASYHFEKDEISAHKTSEGKSTPGSEQGVTSELRSLEETFPGDARLLMDKKMRGWHQQTVSRQITGLHQARDAPDATRHCPMSASGLPHLRWLRPLALESEQPGFKIQLGNLEQMTTCLPDPHPPLCTLG